MTVHPHSLVALASLTFALAFSPLNASASEPVISLDYEAPSECPGAEDVRRSLARLLGDATERGAPLAVKGRIEGRPGGRYHLRLSMQRAQAPAVRDFDASSCETLAETAALLIALAHDPDAVERLRAAPPPADPGPVPPTNPAPPAPVSAPPVPTAPAPPMTHGGPVAFRASPRPEVVDEPSIFGVELRAGPVAGAADLPEVHGGMTVGAALRVEEYTFEGAFELALGSVGTLDDRPAAGADFTLFTGIVRGCRSLYPFVDRPWPRPQGGVELGACAGIELGEMAGEGFGVSRPTRGAAFWAAPRVDARFAVGIAGPLSLGVDLGVAFPTDPRRFVIGGEGSTLVVHEPGPAAGRAAVLLDLGF